MSIHTCDRALRVAAEPVANVGHVSRMVALQPKQHPSNTQPQRSRNAACEEVTQAQPCAVAQYSRQQARARVCLCTREGGGEEEELFKVGAC